MQVEVSRFPGDGSPGPDLSHPAMAVNLDACIHCNLCVRACREVQVNDVIGMAWRGSHEKIVFDFDDAMGASTCVACGECVQACPTGALMPKSIVDGEGRGVREADREVHSVCPYCGVGCQITYKIRGDEIAWVEGRGGPANENRLCVKGRFGFDYVTNPERLMKPLIRKPGLPKGLDMDPRDPSTHFREASWEEALDFAARGLKDVRDRKRRAGARRIRVGEVLQRGGLSVPEAGAHRLRLQQRRPLHAPLPCLLGGGAHGDHRLGRGHRALHRGSGLRRHRGDRRQPRRESPRRRHLFQAGGQTRRAADRDGSAGPGAQAPRHPHAAVQERHRRVAPQCHDERDRHRRALRPAVHPGAHRRLREAQGASRPVHARGDGPGMRHRCRRHPHRRQNLCPGQGSDHLLGHGRVTARPRHRQRALPDLAGAHVRAHGPGRHGTSPLARPEQCAGGLRRRAHSDGLPGLCAGRTSGKPAEVRKTVGDGARSRTRA